MLTLMEKIHRGDFLLMDGAMGTELERRAKPIEGTAWSAAYLADDSETICQIHKDYINAGAEIHIVNSFALSRHVLESVDLGNEFEALNRQSVELFDLAVSQLDIDRSTLFAAGSLSTFAANSDRTKLPKGQALIKNYVDQANILYKAGVDLFALEMLFDIEVSNIMVKAVEKFDLPFIVGFTCEWGERNGNKIPIARNMGDTEMTLEEILPGVISNISSPNAIFSIMHCEPDVTDAGMEILKKYWQGPIAIYPNSGQFNELQLEFDSVCEVDTFRSAAENWIKSGAQIVGGCCGIGPQHIASIGKTDAQALQ